ncbi:hypothetical protein B0I35DRAFT_210681 [Stachybotrys elegans]|uniref:Uncharacterized protein n=1 Tax=Stachybotrys elegans TaxID=80388 RepID=A0A8K0SSM7_9HYPO|nr:hypothetical protein B0I35DRAFT_210681 [Stachybotrys elegans]
MGYYYRDFVDGIKAFTPQERRNIALYITGIMLYKFGLEAFNGSITALLTNRYDYEAAQSSSSTTRTLQQIGLAQGLNQAFQCVGSILIAPLIKRYPTKNVLSCAIVVFGVFTAIILVMDAATGGTFIPDSYRGVNHPKNEYSYYGDYVTDGIIPVWSICGVAYGMVELIRRVIPRDIVGGNVQKLRKMDAIVHIFYEVSGTVSAFVTALVLIPQLGNNRSFIITPILFCCAGIVWYFISELGFKREIGRVLEERPAIIRAIFSGFWLFGESIVVGAKIIFSSRRFIWLLPSYGVALYAHRYLENGIATQVAKRYLGEAGWSQIIVGGSNLGELFGALFVFLFTNVVQTPIPWLRLDALMLLVIWYIPYWYPPSGDVGQAWKAAATLIPVSMGWAAGDVSLAAYIQAALGRRESTSRRVSALGAVMAFLYSFYVVTYAIAGTLLGLYLDSVYDSTGGNENGGDIHSGLVFTAGVQFTIISVLILISTFIPEGALALNPKTLYREDLDDDYHDNEFTLVKSNTDKAMVDAGECHDGIRVRTPEVVY